MNKYSFTKNGMDKLSIPLNQSKDIPPAINWLECIIYCNDFNPRGKTPKEKDNTQENQGNFEIFHLKCPSPLTSDDLLYARLPARFDRL